MEEQFAFICFPLRRKRQCRTAQGSLGAAVHWSCSYAISYEDALQLTKEVAPDVASVAGREMRRRESRGVHPGRGAFFSNPPSPIPEIERAPLHNEATIFVSGRLYQVPDCHELSVDKRNQWKVERLDAASQHRCVS
jgi:hypothetical protein